MRKDKDTRKTVEFSLEQKGGLVVDFQAEKERAEANLAHLKELNQKERDAALLYAKQIRESAETLKKALEEKHQIEKEKELVASKLEKERLELQIKEIEDRNKLERQKADEIIKGLLEQKRVIDEKIKIEHEMNAEQIKAEKGKIQAREQELAAKQLAKAEKLAKKTELIKVKYESKVKWIQELEKAEVKKAQIISLSKLERDEKKLEMLRIVESTRALRIEKKQRTLLAQAEKLHRKQAWLEAKSRTSIEEMHEKDRAQYNYRSAKIKELNSIIRAGEILRSLGDINLARLSKLEAKRRIIDAKAQAELEMSRDRELARLEDKYVEKLIKLDKIRLGKEERLLQKGIEINTEEGKAFSPLQLTEFLEQKKYILTGEGLVLNKERFKKRPPITDDEFAAKMEQAVQIASERPKTEKQIRKEAKRRAKDIALDNKLASKGERSLSTLDARMNASDANYENRNNKLETQVQANLIKLHEKESKAREEENRIARKEDLHVAKIANLDAQNAKIQAERERLFKHQEELREKEELIDKANKEKARQEALKAQEFPVAPLTKKSKEIEKEKQAALDALEKQMEEKRKLQEAEINGKIAGIKAGVEASINRNDAELKSKLAQMEQINNQIAQDAKNQDVKSEIRVNEDINSLEKRAQAIDGLNVENNDVALNAYISNANVANSTNEGDKKLSKKELKAAKKEEARRSKMEAQLLKSDSTLQTALNAKKEMEEKAKAQREALEAERVAKAEQEKQAALAKQTEIEAQAKVVADDLAKKQAELKQKEEELKLAAAEKAALKTNTATINIAPIISGKTRETKLNKTQESPVVSKTEEVKLNKTQETKMSAAKLARQRELRELAEFKHKQGVTLHKVHRRPKEEAPKDLGKTKETKVSGVNKDKTQSVKLNKTQETKVGKTQSVKLNKTQETKVGSKTQEVKINKTREIAIPKANADSHDARNAVISSLEAEMKLSMKNLEKAQSKAEIAKARAEMAQLDAKLAQAKFDAIRAEVKKQKK